MGQKKGNYKPRLSLEESKRIIELYLEGKTQEQISFIVDRSRSVIRQRIYRASDFGVQLPNYITVPVKHEYKETEELDLSSLPDNVFFKHSKEYIL